MYVPRILFSFLTIDLHFSFQGVKKDKGDDPNEKEPPKKYRLTEEMKKIFWELYCLSNESSRLTNEKKWVFLSMFLNGRLFGLLFIDLGFFFFACLLILLVLTPISLVN